MPDDKPPLNLEPLKGLLKLLPLNKLDKSLTANLAVDFGAMSYTFWFTWHSKDEALSTVTWLFVMVLCFACVLWASRQ